MVQKLQRIYPTKSVNRLRYDHKRRWHQCIFGLRQDRILRVEDQVSWEEEKFSYLHEVFRDGELLNQENLETIRQRVRLSLRD